MINRRTFIASVSATLTLLPFAARAAAHAGDTFATDNGEISVFPVHHASFVMQTPAGVIYCDPVGGAEKYADFPAADLVLITHEHGDHYDADTLAAIVTENTRLVTNQGVFDMLTPELQAKATAMANGDTGMVLDVVIDAIPAHNLTESRMKFHPVGRDNGYVLNIDDFRIYISGDTEDVPEMRELKDIDLAFVCMNLPFTMDAVTAASAVAEFKPNYSYPYHFRGSDGGTQDPELFAKAVGTASEVKIANWY